MHAIQWAYRQIFYLLCNLGASSGIGAATAVAFAKHGVKLAINGRNAENLEKTAKKCYEAGLKETEV